MRNFLKYLTIIFCILFSNFNYGLDCYLPEGCRLDIIFYDNGITNSYNEKGSDSYKAIICNVNNNEYSFEFNDQESFNASKKCIENYETISLIILRWTRSNELTILESRFNITNFYRFTTYFKYVYFMQFSNGINGFDVQLYDAWDFYGYVFLEILTGRLDFYHNKKRIESCQDFIDMNITQIRSIFQMSFKFNLKNIEYKHNICPLVFDGTLINEIGLYDMFDTFYKKNVLKFSNEAFQKLNSTITSLGLFKVQNINLDLSLVHPSIFKNLQIMYFTSGTFNSINGEIFKTLLQLRFLHMDPSIFRKINHKQGIEWIKQINYGINLNFSDKPSDTVFYKGITFIRTYMNTRNRMSKIFPDEDFCHYVDFPFRQLVIVSEKFIGTSQHQRDYKYIKQNKEYSCTYLWLVQYYGYYKKYLYFDEMHLFEYIEEVMNTTAFKLISRCNFEETIKSCNKSNYQIKNIWDENDFSVLNKKIQIAFKISIYPVSLFGLISNFIVVLVILNKGNTDLFKECKQYNYLYMNSIFCMMISVIELLSWMTECFYPFEVFCPETRKLVAIQFFKIIFQECLVTVFRFMCNFTYIAFSLNRISLLGKDHGKIVTFMSEVGIKKYIGVTFIISSFLSWIKGFKYEVNYLYPNSNFPMSNELSIIVNEEKTFNDVYFIINVISDLVNYLVFVVICIIIDICMVVQLRRILEEKLKKSLSLNQKQNVSKTTECEEIVNKAIKMVVLNSVIGIFFKLPVSFLPLLNVFADFFFKKLESYYLFIEFYSALIDSGFYALIQDMSHFFFTLALSIQLFIYYRFDKKFLIGYQRLKDKAFIYIKNRFKLTNDESSLH